MRKVTGIVLAMAMLLMAQIGFAKDDPFRGCDPNAPGKGDIEFVKADKNSAQYKIHLDPYQVVEQKLESPKWQVSASYHYLVDKAWQYALPKNDNYKAVAEQLDANTLLVTVSVTGSDVGVYNLRFWGEDTKTSKPMWINRNSQYCRNSSGGFQGYEVILDTKKNTNAAALVASNAPVKK